jgi:hypothetical protein
MVTITITSEDGRDSSFEVDNYSMEADYGLAKVEGDGGLTHPESNGQFRILLKAWRGCAGYEHFFTEYKSSGTLAPDPVCGGKHPADAPCPFCNPISEEPI